MSLPQRSQAASQQGERQKHAYQALVAPQGNQKTNQRCGRQPNIPSAKDKANGQADEYGTDGRRHSAFGEQEEFKYEYVDPYHRQGQAQTALPSKG